MEILINEIIQLILQDIDSRRDVTYEDRNSVRQYNAAMRRILQNAKYIDTHFPDELDRFVELCDHPDPYVVDHVTDIVFNLENTNQEHKRIAFNAMHRRLDDPDIDRVAVFTISNHLIEYTECIFPEEWERYMRYLEHTNHEVVKKCAGRILESRIASIEDKSCALHKLQELYSDPNVSEIDKMAISGYLKKWKKF